MQEFSSILLPGSYTMSIIWQVKQIVITFLIKKLINSY